MALHPSLRTGGRALAAGAGLAAAGYAAWVARAWSGYGHPPQHAYSDALLDRVMPTYEVAERHHIHVRAPAALTLDAATEIDIGRSPLVRALFRGRELLLGAAPPERPPARGLLADMLALGWGVLAEEHGREIVVGAVTKPWEADVRFRAMPADAFTAFDEPGFAKIAWTLRADPTGPDTCTFSTETRVSTTDPVARRRFRLYWATLSPGIVLIRQLLLRPVKREAERRARRA